MAEDHILFNPGPLPVVYDSQGHVLDPQERITVNPNGAVVKALLASELLVDQGPASSSDQAPEPKQAVVEDDPMPMRPNPTATDSGGRTLQQVVVEDGE